MLMLMLMLMFRMYEMKIREMVVVVDIYCQHERSLPWTTLYIQKVDLLGEARAKRKSSGLKIILRQSVKPNLVRYRRDEACGLNL